MDSQKYYEPFEGYLLKRGEKFLKAWQRRWFSLQNNILSYRESPLDVTIRGKISLADVSVFPTDPQMFGQGGYFQINTKNRIYFLCADSAEEMGKWVSFLNHSQTIWREKMKAEIAPSAPPSYIPGSSENHTPEGSTYSSGGSSYGSYDQQQNNVTTGNPPPVNPEIGASYHHPRMTEKFVKEIYFTEGDGLKYYIDTFKSCCEVVIGNHALPAEELEYRQLICTYLGLKTLECDNHEAFSYNSYFDLWERQGFYPHLSHTLSQLQQYLLGRWVQDAPAILTRMDTWAKRKKGLQGMIFQRGDKESIYKWNIIFLNMLLTDYMTAPSSHVITQFRPLVVMTLERALKDFDRLPYSLLPDFTWETFGIGKLHSQSDLEKNSLRNLLFVYIMFQQIRQENDLYQLSKGDSHLENKFLEISTQFSNTFRTTPGYSAVQQLIRTEEKKIFAYLQHYKILSFNPNRIAKLEPYTAVLRNSRVMKRCAGKLNKNFHGNLQNSFLLCAIYLEEKIKNLQVEHKTTLNVPYPDAGYDLLYEMLHALRIM